MFLMHIKQIVTTHLHFIFKQLKKGKSKYNEGILCYPCPYSSVWSPSNLLYSKFTSIVLNVRSKTRVMLESGGVMGRGDSTHALSVKSQYYIVKNGNKTLPVMTMALLLFTLRVTTSHPSLFRLVLQSSFCSPHCRGNRHTGSSP